MDNKLLIQVVNLKLSRDDFMEPDGLHIRSHLPPHELLQKLRSLNRSLQYIDVHNVLKSQAAKRFFGPTLEMNVVQVKTTLDPKRNSDRKMWACISLNSRFWTF